MVVVINILDYLQAANGVAVAGYGGLVAGVLHHILIQYPRQAEIFTTIYAFIAGSIGIGGLFWYISNNPPVWTLFRLMGLFDLIYVFSCILQCLLTSSRLRC